MGRAPCCAKIGLHRGPWTAKEDTLLTSYIHSHGEGDWKALPQKAGLLRCGKSCRLRWMNYLRPGIKRGNITSDEEDLIIRMHSLLGNRWSLIAGRLPGRTDNEIKNYWNTHLRKRLRTQPNTHGKPLTKCVVNKKKENTEKENRGHCVKLYVPKAVRVKTTIMSSLHNDVTLERTRNDGSYYNLNAIDGGGPCNLDIGLFMNGFDFDFGLDFDVPDLANSSLENTYAEYVHLVNNFNMDEEFVNLDSLEPLFM